MMQSKHNTNSLKYKIVPFYFLKLEEIFCKVRKHNFLLEIQIKNVKKKTPTNHMPYYINLNEPVKNAEFVQKASWLANINN